MRFSRFASYTPSYYYRTENGRNGGTDGLDVKDKIIGQYFWFCFVKEIVFNHDGMRTLNGWIDWLKNNWFILGFHSLWSSYLIKFLTEHLRFIATRNLDALFLYYYNQFFFEILSTKMCTLKNTAYKEKFYFSLIF